MMGLGRGVNGAGGNPPSSTSNLSASAPPFTVDRSNSNNNLNSLSRYPESNYGTEPFCCNWKYTNSPSHKPELDMHFTRTTSFPSSDDYRLPDTISTSPSPTHRMSCNRDAKTSGNTLVYGGVKSFYTPSVPPMVEESSALVENGSVHVHSVINHDYRPEWMDRLDFHRFVSGQQCKRVELGGSLSSGKEKIGDMSAEIDYTHCATDQDYMPQQMDSLDINGIQYRRVDGSCSSHMENAGDMSSQFWQYRPKQIDRLNINGNLYKRAELDGNFLSKRAEIRSSHDNTNYLSEGSGIEFRGKSGEIYGRSNPITGRAAQNLTVECVNDKLCFEEYPSFLISGSTYPVSFPPLSQSHEMHKDFVNYKNSSSSYEKCVRPVDSAFTSSISVTRSSPTVVIRPPPSIPGILGQRKPAENDSVAGICNVHFDNFDPSNNKDPGPKPRSEIKEGSLDPKVSNQCNDRGILSSSVENKFSSSLPINDTVGGNIKERFGSQISDLNFSHGLVMADGVQGVNSVNDSSDFIDHQNLAVDSPCWKGAPSSQFSEFDVEAGNTHDFIGKLNENFGFDEAKHRDVRLLDYPIGGFPAKAGQTAEDDADLFVKNNVVVPLDSNLGANNPRKERILPDDAKADAPENLNCGSHTQNYDLKHFREDEVRLNLNDAPESSDAVAFHVAEKVLASPSSQEDATEHSEQQPDPTKTMIKTMHYLSEMLRFHLSNDARALEEEDILALNHSIINLGTCISKIAQPRNYQEPSNPMEYISEKFGGYHDMGTVDYKHGHAKDGKRTEKSPVFSSLRDGIDIMTRDDGMTKTIKKVLDDNFHCNEEMDSQAILFKSLWLEAEATLCSISYKARFDRLKTEMEQAKPKSSKENKDVTATMQKVHISPAPSKSSEPTLDSQDSIPKPTTKSQNSSVSINVQDDGKNDSVMSRFNILKSRDDQLKSKDIRNEQQSKTTFGDQSEGEALNMPDFWHQVTPIREEHNRVAGYGYEPGHSRSNTLIT